MKVVAFSRRLLATLMFLGSLGSTASAQFFGGAAGSTIQGDYLRGLGFAAAGLGIYNEKTAIAESINLDTFIRWNEYMAAVANEQRKEYVARRREHSAAIKEANEKIADRITNRPEARDVITGDALTAAMGELMDPQIAESSYRSAQVLLPVDMIRRIPFRLGERGENFSMNRFIFKGKGQWPVAFQDKRFAAELREFEMAVDEALDEAIAGNAQMNKMARIQRSVENLRQKLVLVIDPVVDARAHNEAALLLKDLSRIAQQFETHGVQRALAEIDKYSGTTVYDLRNFMRSYKLTFGRAETPDERKLYPELYEALQIQREKFAGLVKARKSD